jgi:D-hydroxyproline dehydrogenase subunit beta
MSLVVSWVLFPLVLGLLSLGCGLLVEQAAGVRLMRTYVGFRPWLPDHLPAIGEDPRVPGFVQASGHEGAGIGLAPATAELVTALIDGKPPPVAAEPFAPGRFAAA